MSVLRWLPIPGGELRPGLDDNERQALHAFDPGALLDAEQLRDPVVVSPFEMTQTPVTVGQFRAFVDDGGYTDAALWADDEPLLSESIGRDRLLSQVNTPGPRTWTTRTGAPLDEGVPVDGVSWFEARAFARAVGARLPTAAEWEWAARGPDHRTFPFSKDLRLVDLITDEMTVDEERVAQQRGLAWFASPAPRLVEEAEPNSPFGLLDLAGNVAEWTADVEKMADSVVDLRVLCSDHHRAPLFRMHACARAVHEPHRRLPGFGFRLARDV